MKLKRYLCHVVFALFPLLLSAQEINFDDLQRGGGDFSRTVTITGLAKEGAKYHEQFLSGDRAESAKAANQNKAIEVAQTRPMSAAEQAKCNNNRSQCHSNCDHVASSDSGSGFFGSLVAMGLNSGCKAICNNMQCTSGSVGAFIGKVIDGERSGAGSVASASKKSVPENGERGGAGSVTSASKKPAPANTVKQFSCTVYCASGNTTRYKGSAESRKKMAEWVGDHADEICAEKRNENSSKKVFSEQQCSEQ